MEWLTMHVVRFWHERITSSCVLIIFGHSVPSNNFPKVYPCSDMGKDSSTLILSFLDLSDFPKYVVLTSEFSSNFVVFNTSDCIPSYMSKYFSFNTFGVGTKSNSINSPSCFKPRFFPHLFTALMSKLWQFFGCLSNCI